VGLITHLHPVPRSMRGTNFHSPIHLHGVHRNKFIPPYTFMVCTGTTSFPHTPSWCAQEQLHSPIHLRGVHRNNCIPPYTFMVCTGTTSFPHTPSWCAQEHLHSSYNLCCQCWSFREVMKRLFTFSLLKYFKSF